MIYEPLEQNYFKDNRKHYFCVSQVSLKDGYSL